LDSTPVLQRCQFGIVINPVKCEFGIEHVSFLGHHVSKEGIALLEKKVIANKEFLQPNTKCKLHEFLGLINFYHHLIPQCAQLLLPINTLKSGNHKEITWTNEAFNPFHAVTFMCSTDTYPNCYKLNDSSTKWS
jgi:hypothetical protein